MAVGGLNQRLAEMNGYNALTDFWYRDLPVLGSKFRYLHELGPERQDRALATVLALPGLPDLTEALSRGQVDIERFLEIRQSADGEEFRRWFRNQGPGGVAALRDQWGRLRSRLGAWVATPAGRCLRFLVSSGVGVVPGAGIAASAIDSFLLERWLPRSQPLSFLLHSYKSIFRGPRGLADESCCRTFSHPGRSVPGRRDAGPGTGSIRPPNEAAGTKGTRRLRSSTGRR